MKHILTILMLTTLVLSCKEKEQQAQPDEVAQKEIAYASFGDKIDDKGVASTEEMAAKYREMAVTDTVSVKMQGKVIEVCQMKGCWMTLDLGNGEEATVKFKDYAFFMPKNISGKEVIVNGLAYVSEVPVAEQQHYAEDAGKSKEEIAAITEPKKTYTFMADGVLIKED